MNVTKQCIVEIKHKKIQYTGGILKKTWNLTYTSSKLRERIVNIAIVTFDRSSTKGYGY